MIAKLKALFAALAGYVMAALAAVWSLLPSGLAGKAWSVAASIVSWLVMGAKAILSVTFSARMAMLAVGLALLGGAYLLGHHLGHRPVAVLNKDLVSAVQAVKQKDVVIAGLMARLNVKPVPVAAIACAPAREPVAQKKTPQRSKAKVRVKAAKAEPATFSLF